LPSISILKNYKISVKATQTLTWTVDDDGPADFKTIQEAINNASSGDTIFVHNGTYYENVVINKTVILMGENRDFTIIDGGKINNNVVTVEANNVSIQNFTIMKSGGVPYGGIFVKPPSSGNIITNNRIIENFYGIYLYFSVNNIISGNLISENTYGIGFTSCSNNFIFGNTILSNVNDGIYFFASFNNVISYNNFFTNGLSGISFYSSNDNVIHGNNISSNLFYGIFLSSSFDNVISANTIINNPSAGMAIVFSSNDNTICRNNFNNAVQVYSSDSTNFWSFNGEGNYWSDYSGEDLNGDGIGDIPYIIDETSQIDNAPLMGIFSEFDISYKGEIYHFTIISNSTISDFQFKTGIETGNKIIRFKPIGDENVAGFCRIMIPGGFMSYPYIVLLDGEEVIPTFLDFSNATHVYLYFTYLHKNQMVTIISSQWYNELLNIYYNLLNIYADLLYNYTVLWDNYTQLQKSLEQLNASYQDLYDLNETFYNFLDDYARLLENFYYLNETYSNLTDLYWKLQMDFSSLNFTYYIILGNYTQLQENYQELNVSYQELLRSYSENVSNVKNLAYVLAAVTAIFIIVIIYLSKHAYSTS
jgi:parallel beta-helix repeat protein